MLRVHHHNPQPFFRWTTSHITRGRQWGARRTTPSSTSGSGAPWRCRWCCQLWFIKNILSHFSNCVVNVLIPMLLLSLLNLAIYQVTICYAICHMLCAICSIYAICSMPYTRWTYVMIYVICYMPYAICPIPGEHMSCYMSYAICHMFHICHMLYAICSIYAICYMPYTKWPYVMLYVICFMPYVPYMPYDICPIPGEHMLCYMSYAICHMLNPIWDLWYFQKWKSWKADNVEPNIKHLQISYFLPWGKCAFLHNSYNFHYPITIFRQFLGVERKLRQKKKNLCQNEIVNLKMDCCGVKIILFWSDPRECVQDCLTAGWNSVAESDPSECQSQCETMWNPQCEIHNYEILNEKSSMWNSQLWNPQCETMWNSRLWNPQCEIHEYEILNVKFTIMKSSM